MERLQTLSDVVLTSTTKPVYHVGQVLGTGRFSTVHKATHLTTQKHYALKVFQNKALLDDDEAVDALETEVNILKTLNDVHVVRIKEVVCTPLETYIVMELVSGGELFDRIVAEGAYSEAAAAHLVAQILLALEYLHSQDIVHRDIKPENILYLAPDSHEIKLIDFGYAGVWSAERPLTGLCGTPDYVAPEVLTWYPDDDATKGVPYGKASDLWSVGVLLFVILSGCSPFAADDEEKLLEAVAEARYEFHDHEWKGVSDDAKDLIRKLLVVDPSKRLTMAQAFEHPFLKQAVSKCREARRRRRKPKSGKAARYAEGGSPDGETPGCHASCTIL